MMYTALVILTSLSLLTTGGRAQQCPVHEDCTCSPHNGTGITCNNLQWQTIPKFLPSHIYFKRLYIKSGAVNSIQTRAFEDLHITRLEINGARIPTLGCSDFAGLERSLTDFTYSFSRTLTAVPRCALSPLTRLTHLYLYKNRITGLTSEDFATIVLLEVLDLSYNQIMRIDPDAFKGLVNLKTLNLYSNRITGVKSEDFATLVLLEVLHLSGNQIMRIDPDAFKRLINLKTLNLFGNRIAGVTSEDFAALVLLEVLHLSGNQIMRIDPDTFKGLINLKTLDLYHNRITGVTSEDFATLVLLEDLNLSYNQITRIDPDAFRGLINLKTLNLYHNRITGVTSEDFETLVLLEDLNLSYNQITRIDPDAFKGFVNLKTLDLSSNTLANPDGLPFRTLKNLTTLKLRNINIANLNAGAFDGLYNLQSLNLDTNNIDDFPEGMFHDVTNLQTLSVRNNKLSRLRTRVFSTLDKLQTLQLDGNNIEDFPEGIFRDVTNLQTLNARNNKLSRLRKSVFSTLDKLTTLSLSMNKLMDIPPDVFDDTTSLRSLDLSDAFLSNCALDPISRINTLVHLRLNSVKNTHPDSVNSLEGFLIDVFHQWPKIESIQLRNNSIKYLQPRAFQNLFNLASLDLADNNLMEIPSYLVTKSPGLEALRFANNEITDIHESMFDLLTSDLYLLDLSGNQLSRESSYRLKETLQRLTGLSFLYLTDMELPPLDADIVTSFSQIIVLQLRNCSLTESTYFSGSTLSGHIDVSDNNLEKFGKRQESVTINGQTVDANVSHNSLSEIHIELPYSGGTSFFKLYGHNNNLREVVVNASHRVIMPILDLSHNFISSPVVVPDQASVTVANLSFNKMSTVTQFPLVTAAEVGGLDRLDPCSALGVATLNLSRNLIASISPEACLGLVTTLDLSHNQLQTLPSLVPTTTDSFVRLQNLYLTGNRLHALTPTLVWEPQVDLYGFLYRNSRFRMYLGDNPLSCDCTGAWMRNGSVPEKLVSARCQSPRDIRLYLVQCYSIDMCGANITSYVRVSSGTKTLCDTDSEIGIEGLTYRKRDNKIYVDWETFGPGSARGFRLVYHDLPNPDNKTQELLRSDHEYHVCIYGQKSDDSEIAPVCVDISGHNSTTEGTGLPANRESTPPEVIGLAVGLGLCALLLAASCCVIGKRYSTYLCCKADPEEPDTRVRVTRPGYEEVTLAGVSTVTTTPEYVNTAFA